MQKYTMSVMSARFGSGRLIGLLLLSLISACASGPSREECQAMDWRTLGYEDGIQGWSQARISSHRKACAQHGVGLDLDAYQLGWEQGMKRYCQPGNGYHQGRTGQEYLGICAADLEKDFLEAYEGGRTLYAAESEVKRLRQKMTHKKKRMDAIEVELRDAGMEIVSPDMATGQRVILLDEIRKLEQERVETRHQLMALEHELAVREKGLALIRQEPAY